MGVPDCTLTMEDTLVMENQNKFQNSSSSHCWEPDGSFHSVCIFVITVSVVCGLITFISVYRIVLMVLDMFREPENINETIKMYKLQPIPTISRQSTAPQHLNSIETVETITCKVAEEDTRTGRSDCLC